MEAVSAGSGTEITCEIKVRSTGTVIIICTYQPIGSFFWPLCGGFCRARTLLGNH